MGRAGVGAIRKQEILDRALELFDEKGYENTTVQDILDAVTIGKGTFYYHFTSKEEILDTLVSNHIDSVISILREVTDNNRYSAVEKLNNMVRSVQNYRIEKAPLRQKLMRIMAKEENLKLAYKYTERIVEETRDLYAAIIEQGIREGTMDTPYPGKTAEAIIRMANHFRGRTALLLDKGDNKEAAEMMKETLLFIQDMVSRLLGMAPGTLDITGIFNREIPEGGV